MILPPNCRELLILPTMAKIATSTKIMPKITAMNDPPCHKKLNHLSIIIVFNFSKINSIKNKEIF